jgi:hypothetical protein
MEEYSNQNTFLGQNISLIKDLFLDLRAIKVNYELELRETIRENDGFDYPPVTIKAQI